MSVTHSKKGPDCYPSDMEDGSNSCSDSLPRVTGNGCPPDIHSTTESEAKDNGSSDFVDVVISHPDSFHNLHSEERNFHSPDTFETGAKDKRESHGFADTSVTHSSGKSVALRTPNSANKVMVI